MNKNFSVKTPIDFNYSECLKFLLRSPLECLFFIKKEKVHFALQIDNQDFLIRFGNRKNKLFVEILSGEVEKNSKKIIKNYILEWLDINRDLRDFTLQSKLDSDYLKASPNEH